MLDWVGLTQDRDPFRPWLPQRSSWRRRLSRGRSVARRGFSRAKHEKSSEAASRSLELLYSVSLSRPSLGETASKLPPPNPQTARPRFAVRIGGFIHSPSFGNLDRFTWKASGGLCVPCHPTNVQGQAVQPVQSRGTIRILAGEPVLAGLCRDPHATPTPRPRQGEPPHLISSLPDWLSKSRPRRFIASSHLLHAVPKTRSQRRMLLS